MIIKNPNILYNTVN